MDNSQPLLILFQTQRIPGLENWKAPQRSRVTEAQRWSVIASKRQSRTQDLGSDASHYCQDCRIPRPALALPVEQSPFCPLRLLGHAPLLSLLPRPGLSHHTINTPPSDTHSVNSLPLPLFTHPFPDLKCEQLGAVTLPSSPVHPFPYLGPQPGLAGPANTLDE